MPGVLEAGDDQVLTGEGRLQIMKWGATSYIVGGYREGQLNSARQQITAHVACPLTLLGSKQGCVLTLCASQPPGKLGWPMSWL